MKTWAEINGTAHPREGEPHCEKERGRSFSMKQIRKKWKMAGSALIYTVGKCPYVPDVPQDRRTGCYIVRIPWNPLWFHYPLDSCSILSFPLFFCYPLLFLAAIECLGHSECDKSLSSWSKTMAGQRWDPCVPNITKWQRNDFNTYFGERPTKTLCALKKKCSKSQKRR